MVRRPFVVVGESLVDIVVPHQGEVVEAPGGSPMNVAVGLARLDVAALLVSELGDDAHGALVANHLYASGVQLSDSTIQPGRRTSTAKATLDERHIAEYDFDLTWDLPPQSLPSDILGLHVGSLGASLSPGRASVVELVRQACDDDTFVSYDLNVRPAFLTDREQAWRDVLEVAGGARVVKLSDEDAAVLRPDSSVEEVAHDLLGSSTTELVVVTAGPGGSTGYTESGSVTAPAPRVTVVDTVGAGDSFMAALVAVLVDWDITVDGPGAVSALDDGHLRLALSAAAVAAAVTCSRRGANPPTRRELPPTWPVG